MRGVILYSCEVIMRNKETDRLYREFKENSKCACCPENDPITIEFHHIDPSTKTASVGAMVHDGADWKTVYAEICKCVTVCGNCHKKIHAGRIAL